LEKKFSDELVLAKSSVKEETGTRSPTFADQPPRPFADQPPRSFGEQPPHPFDEQPPRSVGQPQSRRHVEQPPLPPGSWIDRSPWTSVCTRRRRHHSSPESTSLPQSLSHWILRDTNVVAGAPPKT